MPDRPDKQARKEMLQTWRAQQRALERTKLPIGNEPMRALFDMLDAELPKVACGHSFDLVRGWASQNRVDFESLAFWCRENGGHCDCEVLANCEERWLDAIRDVAW